MRRKPLARYPRTTTRRTWLWRFTVLLAALLAVVSICELLVRLLWQGAPGGYPAGMFVADADVGFRLQPDFSARHTTPDYDIEIRTNERGYRSPPIAAKPAGRRRILALGDSFAFGHGVDADASFPAVASAELNARGLDVEIVNAGVPGYGTANACALLAADGDVLQLDAVVLGFYVGNDFRDNDTDRFGRLTARSGMLVTLHNDDSDLRVTMLAALLVNCRAAQLLFLGFGGGVKSEEAVIRDFCAAAPWDPGFGIAMLHRDWDEAASHAFAVSTHWLQVVADHCRERHWPLLLVLLPGPYQYHDALWNMLIDKCALDAAVFDRAHPNTALLAWATAQGVATLDLLPAFSSRSAGPTHVRLYGDVHFNAAGHRLAGQMIADHLAPLLAK